MLISMASPSRSPGAQLLMGLGLSEAVAVVVGVHVALLHAGGLQDAGGSPGFSTACIEVKSKPNRSKRIFS